MIAPFLDLYEGPRAQGCPLHGKLVPIPVRRAREPADNRGSRPGPFCQDLLEDFR